MKYYLKDVLTRLQKQSATLDQSAFLVDKPWVVSNSEEAFEKLIFKRDGSLYLSSNGDVTEGKWEYLPEAHSLLIDYGDKKKLYRHQYLDEAVLALKIDGPNLGDDSFYLLANENKVPDYDAKKYLINKLKHPKQLRNLSGKSGEVRSIKDNYRKHKSGRYISPDGSKMIELVDNKVAKTYKPIKYANGTVIWQSKPNPSTGDVVDTGISCTKLMLKANDGTKYILNVKNDGLVKTARVSLFNPEVIVMIIFLIIALIFLVNYS